MVWERLHRRKTRRRVSVRTGACKVDSADDSPFPGGTSAGVLGAESAPGPAGSPGRAATAPGAARLAARQGTPVDTRPGDHADRPQAARPCHPAGRAAAGTGSHDRQGPAVGPLRPGPLEAPRSTRTMSAGSAPSSTGKLRPDPPALACARPAEPGRAVEMAALYPGTDPRHADRGASRCRYRVPGPGRGELRRLRWALGLNSVLPVRVEGTVIMLSGDAAGQHDSLRYELKPSRQAASHVEVSLDLVTQPGDWQPPLASAARDSRAMSPFYIPALHNPPLPTGQNQACDKPGL